MLVEATSSIQLGFGRIRNGDGTRVETRETVTLVGRSRAGEATSFAIPELKWMFDCGALIQGWKPRILFLTHTHVDHVHMLPLLLAISATPTTQVFLPARAVPLVQRFLQAHHDLTEFNTDDTCADEHDSAEEPPSPSASFSTSMSTSLETPQMPQYNLIPVNPNDTFYADCQGNYSVDENYNSHYVIKTVACDHRIDCIGYSIYRIRHVLKDEYTSLSTAEIRQLRRQGTAVTTPVHQSFVCYLGDTTNKVWETHPEILRDQSQIIIECSFLDTRDFDRARKTQHMLWQHLKPIVESHSHILFVLIHFSLKYKEGYIRDFFQRESLHGNLHPMLADVNSVSQQQQQAQSAQQESNENGKATETRTGEIRCTCFVCKPYVADK
jgi:ribonuclease Z